jgi:uncharacterized small protein (DUF1192 family)
MTIKQALKHKNKLSKKISDEIVKVSHYNSVEVGSVRPYDVNECYQKYFMMVNELVDLKNKIHLANAPVYYQIFRLSELKGMVSNLKQLDCSEGKVASRYGRSLGEEPTIKTSVISVKMRDEAIESLESEIERIQEELDHHNAITTI